MKHILAYIMAHSRIFYLLLAMSVTVALIILMFPGDFGKVQYDYAVGSYWKSNDLYAPYDFAVMRSHDDNAAEMQQLRDEATLYFTFDSSARATSSARLKNANLSPALHRNAQKVLDYVSSTTGYANIDDISDQQHIVLLNGNIGHQCEPGSIVTPSDIVFFVDSIVGDSLQAALLSDLLVDSILAPSVVLDENRTHLELDSRLSQLNTSSRMVLQDELIVAKGQHIDEETAQTIAAFEQAESERRQADINLPLHYTGLAMLCIIAFVALYIFLKNIRHPMLQDTKKVTFAFFVVLLAAAIVALLVRVKVDWVLLAPMCIVPILIRVFFDMRVALYIHIVAVIIIGNMVPNSYEFIFYQLVSGMMSIITVRHLEKRSSFFIVALVIFATYSLIYIAGVLSQDASLANLQANRFLIFFLNATLTLLAYPLIFLFERMFGMTTNLTLLEISSTNTPALRDLSQKAPGTFQHSMQVANIAEDIVNEIGGNSLLTRVGALYHDIGKLMAPLYFTENQNAGFNPHENLEYEESARIITQHVRDGIALAKKYRLPSQVTDFIRTHHGTTMTGYFYAQAKLHMPEDEIDIQSFRYMGPTPFSRETAVVMMVDSVEAACRSLKSHDKESISRMVDNIINDKISHNQFNNCPLTLRDISLIRTKLKEKMMSIYHVRVAYPVVK